MLATRRLGTLRILLRHKLVHARERFVRILGERDIALVQSSTHAIERGLNAIEKMVDEGDRLGDARLRLLKLEYMLEAIEILLDVRRLEVANVRQHERLIADGILDEREAAFFASLAGRFANMKQCLAQFRFGEARHQMDRYFTDKNLLGLVLMK